MFLEAVATRPRSQTVPISPPPESPTESNPTSAASPPEGEVPRAAARWSRRNQGRHSVFGSMWKALRGTKTRYKYVCDCVQMCMRQVRVPFIIFANWEYIYVYV